MTPETCQASSNLSWVGPLLGVIVGSMLTIAKDWFFNWRSQKPIKNYSAIRVACVLQIFIKKCFDVVHDDGYPLEDDRLEPEVETPRSPEFPDDIDWKLFDPKLVYQILTLPARMDDAKETIAFIATEIAGPPYYEEFFEARKYHYSQLGVEAYQVTQKLIQDFKLNKDFGPSSQIVEKFQSIIKSYREANS